jgi:GT2 family glycosyltransferase
MYRLELFDKVGFFDPNAWAEDFDMNLRIAERYKLGYIDDFLACYRRGGNSNSSKRSYKISQSHRYSIEKFCLSPYYKEAITRWHLRTFLWHAGQKNMKLVALSSLTRCFNLPINKTFIKGIRDLFLIWH